MLGVLLAMLPQLRGVETEVRVHALRGFLHGCRVDFCMILLARGPFGVARIRVANLQMRTLMVEVEEGSM